MTCQKTLGGKKSKTQRGKRSNRRKTQKGGFWPFTSSSTSSSTADPNAPKKPGFFSSLFGSSKKPAPVEEVSNPIVNAPNPEAQAEVKTEAPVEAKAAEAAKEVPEKQEGGKRRRKKRANK